MQKLCKRFGFEEANRSRLTFSDSTKIRLNPITHTLELKQLGVNKVTGQPIYSTDADLSVTTWLTNPQTVKQWIGFSVNPQPQTQPAGTSVGFKLSDGTDDYYWDGGAWAVAGASDWSTEYEVVDNISSFDASSQKLALVINLATTDENVTPTVKSIKVLMSCQIDYLYSIIVSSLAPSLLEKIRPRIDFVLRSTGSDVLSLKDLETEFNILSVDAVYDEHNDPSHTTDLLVSFDAATQNLKLSSAVERGRTVWVEMTVEPEIYINWASQDYVEVEKLPAIVIDSFSMSGAEVFGLLAVPDISAKTAVVRRSPFRLQLSFDVVLLAEKTRTLLAMHDKALEHAATTRLLPWRAVDEYLSLQMEDEGLFQARPNLSDKHESRYTLRLDDVFLWLQPEEVLPLIERVNVTLASPELEGGPRWTGA